MYLLSSVRMGINLGLIDDLEIPTVNELFIHTQPAHLQKIQGAPLEVDERNVRPRLVPPEPPLQRQACRGLNRMELNRRD